MTESPLPSDLDALLNGLIDGTLSPEDHGRLESILSVSRKARSRYLDYISTQMDLESLYGIEPESSLEALVSRMESVNRQTAAQGRQRWRRGALLACCGLLFVGAVLWLRPVAHSPEPKLTEKGDRAAHRTLAPSESNLSGETPSAPQVRLTQASQAELFGQLLPEIGAPLNSQEEFVLVRGAIQLTFENGAQALIDAPAVFLIESADRLNLKTGRCSVHAPPGAEGFEVITPMSRVVDLGTRFAVNVNEIGASEVHVIEGAAEVYTAGETEQMNRLGRGEALKSTNENDLARIPFSETAFQNALPDRVISYEASPDPEAPEFVRELRNVTLQRGGISYRYEFRDLIGVDVVDFVSEGDPSCLAWDREFPDDPALSLHDASLRTGICNFGSIAAARLSHEKRRGERPSQRGTPRMEIRFRTPVVNSDGPDIVLFETQPAIHSIDGDAFYARPAHDFPGSRRHHIARFDISMNSRNARRIRNLRLAEYERAPQSLEDFVTIHYQWKVLKFPFYVLAVGIDLSDLGYAPGETCEGLILEDGDDDRNFVDPVLIGGLPPVLSSSPVK